MERQSNIELFRIVACLFILIVHCNGWFLKEWGNIQSWYAGRDLWVGLARNFIQSFSCIGVDCFILISGYFSIKPKLKSLVNLATILLFFYVGMYVCNCFYTDTALELKGFIRNCLVFSRKNWYIQCYVFLILLSPMANAFVCYVSERYLFIYLVIFLLCSFYFGCVHNSEHFYFNRGYSVTTFLLLYVIGRYIGLYGVHKVKKLSMGFCLFLYILSVGGIMFVRWLLLDEEQYLSYNSPFLIISACLLLLCFTKLQINSKIVNWIARSCLSVFIFHVSPPVIYLLANKDVYLFNNYSFATYLLYMGGVVIIVFVCAVLLDKIRVLLFLPLMNLFDRK